MIIGGVILLIISMLIFVYIALNVRKHREQSEEIRREIMLKMININFLGIFVAVIGLGLVTVGLIFR